MKKVKVPDVEGPKVNLCWEQKLTPPLIMARCDRRKGHNGPHTWELLERLNDVTELTKAGSSHD